MQKDFRLLWIAFAAGSLLLTGCGKGGNLNQQMLLPTQQSQLQPSPYAYATPLQPSAQNASAQARPGGRAIATPSGYVYEQDSSTNNAAYNFYHSQNPCLYPKPGQATACASGSSGYYAGQQQQQGQLNQINQMQPNLAYGQPQYGSQTSQFNQGSQMNPYASPYGSGTAVAGMTPGYNMTQMPTGTTNPYGGNNPYASLNSQPIQNNPYASQFNGMRAPQQPVTQPLPLPQPQSQAVSSQSAGQSEAQRAQSRIAPDGAETGSSSGGGKQKITF
ncbi:MAG: hypothetical protein IGS03_16240 [Candidatus Sericytochromatia bacterium]|nr:hypothetical protein [Candidatus Sericytochromatia bacterium]